MSNQERAAKVIDRWTKDGGELNSVVGSPHEIATLLADDSLLMPDFPEPDDASIFVPDGAGWQTPQDSTVWTAIGGRVMVQRVEPGNFTPGEARSLAYALLAAAKHAEEQK